MNYNRETIEPIVRLVLSILDDINYEKKAANARRSVEKALAKGSYLGRNKKRDDVRIAELRKQGLSIRAIAKEAGVSSTVVQRSLKESCYGQQR